MRQAWGQGDLLGGMILIRDSVSRCGGTKDDESAGVYDSLEWYAREESRIDYSKVSAMGNLGPFTELGTHKGKDILGDFSFRNVRLEVSLKISK